MQISSEGKIGIGIGFLALAGGGAIMVFPDQFWIGWTMIAIAAIGLIWLGFHHFGIRRQRMTPAIGMIVFGVAFLACSAWYFWPTRLGFVEQAKKEQDPVNSNSSIKPAEKKERIFVPPELTPERLLSFFHENTAIQATELTKDRIGQWMHVTGTVRNVGAFSGVNVQVSFEKNYVEPRTWFDYADIYCYFREPQIDRLKILKQGDKVTVIGQIAEIAPLVLNLGNCELLDTESK